MDSPTWRRLWRTRCIGDEGRGRQSRPEGKFLNREIHGGFKISNRRLKIKALWRIFPNEERVWRSYLEKDSFIPASDTHLKGTSFLFQLESHIISFTIKNNSKMLLIQFGIKVRVVWAPFLILKYEPNTAAIFRHIFIIHNRILIYSIIHELVTKQRQERTNIEYDRVK